MKTKRQHQWVQFLWNMTRRCGMGGWVLAHYPNSMLVRNGWFRSYRQGVPVDAQGQPLPWWTYSCMDFISSRITADMAVFEYGCGHSTRWFSQRVKRVDAVESQPKWVERISPLLPDNASVVLETQPERYATAPAGKGPFHIILVDGIERIRCYQQACQHLTDDGIIIADDSGRDDFKTAWPALQKEGFKEITFAGLTPGHFVKSQTSLLYRDRNCFNI